MVEGARFEIWCARKGTVGSNPTLSATHLILFPQDYLGRRRASLTVLICTVSVGAAGPPCLVKK